CVRPSSSSGWAFDYW
nr:immunoglobulin heavy chain junction region [Macaca mulatta]